MHVNGTSRRLYEGSDSILINLAADTAETRATVHHIHQDVVELKERVGRLERTRAPSFPFRELLPLLYGLAVLLAAVAGRMTWGDALSLLRAGSG